MNESSAESAHKTTALLIHQFRFNQYALAVNTRDVTQEESLVQPSRGGNCLNWIVGHVLAIRHEMLHAALDLPATWDAVHVERYKRASAPVTGSGAAAELNGMLTAYAASQDLVLPALGDLGWERLDDLTTISPGKNPEETIGSLVAGLAFHEAYHVGQTGILRRLIGREGILS